MDYLDKTELNTDGLEAAVKGSPVSRRWFLRNTANAAAGSIAATALGAAATTAEAAPITLAHHEGIHTDQPTGYVHSLHGWDTI